MSISLLIEDRTLARMLLLEARRQGFRQECEPTLLFVDLDHFTPPRELAHGTLVIGISADPGRLSQSQRESVSALLSLPFSVREFQELLRRAPSKSATCTVRREGNRLWLNQARITLSATEARLFDLLYEHRDRVVSESELKAVLGESADRTNTLAVYLYRLRRKLSAEGVARIKTVRGKGCQWIEESR